MKNRILILLCYLVITSLILGLFLAVLLPFISWKIKDSYYLDIWILDKTVPVNNYREHKGLVWILNNMKIFNKKTKVPFEFDRDYYGFFPEKENKYTIKKLPKNIIYPALIYIADTYGVYSDDFQDNNYNGTRSKKIYGGLDEEDYTAITNNLGNGNTVIGEFNTALSPTESIIKEKYGKIFGVKWSDWIGRHFNDLDKDFEVPIWMVTNYEKQYKEKWKFKGPGIVLVSSNDSIVVLMYNKHIGEKGITIKFEKNFSSEFGVDTEIPYRYWFEFVLPENNTEIIAKYNFDLTLEGKAEFDRIGVKNFTAAIVRKQFPDNNSYYFAGDYADNNRVNKNWNISGYTKLKELLTFDTEDNMDFFYWKCYVPVMEEILKDIKQRKIGVENKLF